jgi:imidazolonepropionase-like amidohydrolase
VRGAGLSAFLVGAFTGGVASAQTAVYGDTVYTMAGAPIQNGLVIVENGKITFVGAASERTPPAGLKVLRARVVTPGLVDAHTIVGLTGLFNQPHDQDQLERSAPIQPELRAFDAYNPHETLIEWVRGFGITTVHTGHAPGELVSGQTMIAKTVGRTVEEAVMVKEASVAVTLSSSAQKNEKGQSPGTRGKMMAMLRQDFIKAREYLTKLDKADAEKKPDRDLKLETLGRVLKKELALMVTADKAQDIASTLRFAREFDIRLWLDSGAECYVLIGEIKAADVSVILHPQMARAYREMQNMSMETAAMLRAAGIRFALQSSYESYVPKTRVVLFEAAIAAANGLSFEEALATITIDAARILGVADRVGSLEAGKDGDIALYDGDPFEYTSHCVGVVINGNVVSEQAQ